MRVAVLGEHAYGVGRGTRTMVGVFVGTGIGGGIIVDGKLHQGARGVAGEIGHMIVEPSGPRCPCGKRGCIEALASRTSMERDVRKRDREGRKSERAQADEEEGAHELVERIIERALERRRPGDDAR